MFRAVWFTFCQKWSQQGNTHCITARQMQNGLADYPMAASHLISRVKKRIKNTLETTLVFNQVTAEHDLQT